jgi:hypothetical protein
MVSFYAMYPGLFLCYPRKPAALPWAFDVLGAKNARDVYAP